MEDGGAPPGGGAGCVLTLGMSSCTCALCTGVNVGIGPIIDLAFFSHVRCRKNRKKQLLLLLLGACLPLRGRVIDFASAEDFKCVREKSAGGNLKKGFCCRRLDA